MNWLLLDTACPRAVVAIAYNQKIVASIYLSETIRHGEKLAEAIQYCLKEAALDIRELNGIAVGQGPGSFVGVRVGIAHAKGICMALEIPLVGICTLSAIGAASNLPFAEGMAFLDARRGEFYARHINRLKKNGQLQIVSLGEPIVLTALDMKKLSLNEGMGGFYTLAHHVDYFEESGVLAEGMLLLLQQRFKNIAPKENINETFSLEPAYVREPDAKKVLSYKVMPF
jgi:tRNA threonylcarbamoyl adenosine modification protein YeaZ